MENWKKQQQQQMNSNIQIDSESCMMNDCCFSSLS